jgi:hypothetical protein
MRKMSLRGTRLQGIEEDCIMRGFMICIVHHIDLLLGGIESRKN